MWISGSDGERLRALLDAGPVRVELSVDAVRDTSLAQRHRRAAGRGRRDRRDRNASRRTLVVSSGRRLGHGVGARAGDVLVRDPPRPAPASLVFLVNGGHMAGGAGCRAFLERYAADLERIVLELHLEHTAAEVVERDGTLCRPVSPNRAGGSRAASRRSKPPSGKRSRRKVSIARLLLTPDALAPHPTTDGGLFHLNGVPLVNFLTAPFYLFDSMDRLDKIHVPSLVPVTRAAIRIIESTRGISAAPCARRESNEGAMPRFDSAGVAIATDDTGAGQAIVLVHGFASSRRRNWKDVGWYTTLIDAGYRVLALDCRGHGESDKPHDPPAYSAALMAGDVIRLMDHVGIERGHLMGYSMGGRIAATLLVQHGDRFVAAVLAGVGAALAEERRDAEAIARVLEVPDAASIKHPEGQAFRAFAERGRNDLEALAACMRGLRHTVDAAELQQIHAPVLVVAGENDTLIGDPRPVTALISGARLVTIPGRDHLNTVGDRRYKAAVVKFLKGSEDRRPPKM